MSIREYDNIIIAAHALDVLIFFYDFITSRSLVVVCSKPKSKLDFDNIELLFEDSKNAAANWFALGKGRLLSKWIGEVSEAGYFHP